MWLPLGLGPKVLGTKVRDLQATWGSFPQECTAQAMTETAETEATSEELKPTAWVAIPKEK